MEICLTSSPLFGRFDAETASKMLADAGFRKFDWSLDKYWNRPRAWKGDFDENGLYHKSVDEIIVFLQTEYDIFTKNGLKTEMAHAPYPLLVSNRPYVAEYTFEVMKKVIKVCSHFGVKYLVVHCDRLFYWEKDKTQADIDADNHAYLTGLIPYLKGSGVTICLENLFKMGEKIGATAGVFCDGDATKKYIEELNELAGEEVFGVCYDVGHMILVGEMLSRYPKALGKHIKCLHLHDNDAIDDRHVLPMTGAGDWFDLIKGLKEGGYEGDINFEYVHQFDENRLPAELIPSFIKITADIGNYICKELEK